MKLGHRKTTIGSPKNFLFIYLINVNKFFTKFIGFNAVFKHFNMIFISVRYLA